MQSLKSFKIHWKAPLQTKGFIKIIEFFLAVLAFSLVAGFSINGHIKCAGETQDAITVSFKYPFSTYTYLNNNSEPVTERFKNSFVKSTSQLFVAWGVMSMLYSVIALTVYMLFTANENLEKVVDVLVYVDLGFNGSFALNWLVASIEWSVGFNRMSSSVMDVLNNIRPLCENAIVNRTQDTYEQAAIAAVFGFLCLFIWTANIYWVVIDTAGYIKWSSRRNLNPYDNM